MKTNNIKIISVLCASLLFTTGLTACSMKDKETVLSTNVNQGVKEEENKIQKAIELGNKYLEEKKYDEAKKTYEKAISININNKQTYLKIKDNYLEKNRLDDAFYIIKLAVDNKVDVLNMKAVLEDIKKKFNVTVIEKSVYQNDTVNLPNQVTVKVNNEDTQADVKWNSSSIDTSKAGNFTVEGTAVQYERPVQFKLKVNSIVKDKKIGWVSEVYESNGKKYLKLDEIEFYTGEEANKEAKKDGAAFYDNGKYYALNDYYMRGKNKGIISYEISNTASLNVIDLFINPQSSDVATNHTVSYEQFKEIINSKNKMPGYILTWIYLENNVVVKAEGQYIP